MNVFWISVPSPGRLGIVARPRGGDWLEVDADVWRDACIDIVVSLLEPDEAIELSLEEEARVVRETGMQFESFPTRDRSVPSACADALIVADKLARLLRDGRTIVVHCRQGIGRSSLLTAMVLMSLGVALDVALAAIRTARVWTYRKQRNSGDGSNV